MFQKLLCLHTQRWVSTFFHCSRYWTFFTIFVLFLELSTTFCFDFFWRAWSVTARAGWPSS